MQPTFSFRSYWRSFVLVIVSPSLLALSLFACSSETAQSESTSMSQGREIYSNPIATGNSFACATCHALSEPATDGLIRPGHQIGDAPFRTSFKNGEVESFLQATNSCLKEWMTVPEPWTEESPEFQLLEEFLVNSLSQEPSSMIEYQIVAPPPLEALLEGEPIAGRALFNQSCSVCHGADGLGTIRAPQVTDFDLNIQLVAERIRLSGLRESSVYEGLIGGRMPFWSAERLNDAQVADLAAYLAMGLPETVESEATQDVSASENLTPESGTMLVPAPEEEEEESLSGPAAAPPSIPTLRSCTATHPRVGDTLELIAFAHDVGGMVTVIDDCTLRFSEFAFDGRGIDVQIYGGLAGQYSQGFSMSGDIRRVEGYEGASFDLNLPVEKTLDDLDGVSIWCVPVGADFGSGRF